MSDSHPGWIGVDFDGTLVEYTKWKGPTSVGSPVKPMIERVMRWLEAGQEVRIFTARVYSTPGDSKRQSEAAQALIAIQRWSFLVFGRVLPVTCVKDFDMIELWDDRAVQVERNTGRRVDGSDKS